MVQFDGMLTPVYSQILTVRGLPFSQLAASSSKIASLLPCRSITAWAPVPVIDGSCQPL